MDTPRAHQHQQLSPMAEEPNTTMSQLGLVRLGLVRDNPPLGAVEVWRAEREGWKVPPACWEQWGRKREVSPGKHPKTHPRWAPS